MGAPGQVGVMRESNPVAAARGIPAALTRRSVIQRPSLDPSIKISPCSRGDCDSVWEASFRGNVASTPERCVSTAKSRAKVGEFGEESLCVDLGQSLEANPWGQAPGKDRGPLGSPDRGWGVSAPIELGLPVVVILGITERLPLILSSTIVGGIPGKSGGP